MSRRENFGLRDFELRISLGPGSVPVLGVRVKQIPSLEMRIPKSHNPKFFPVISHGFDCIRIQIAR